jgi:hypothetical protein
MNVSHLHAHVSYVLSHMAQHASSLVDLVGTMTRPDGIRTGPLV